MLCSMCFLKKGIKVTWLKSMVALRVKTNGHSSFVNSVQSRLRTYLVVV